MLSLLALFAIAIFASDILFAKYTDTDLSYWDSTTSYLNLLTMWLQSRKKIESLILWFIIDVLDVGIYFYKGIYFYSLPFSI